jgi:hypothetical protein
VRYSDKRAGATPGGAAPSDGLSCALKQFAPQNDFRMVTDLPRGINEERATIAAHE